MKVTIDAGGDNNPLLLDVMWETFLDWLLYKDEKGAYKLHDADTEKVVGTIAITEDGDHVTVKVVPLPKIVEARQ